jgi:hypothetical protein
MYEDACELQMYFILERDRLTKDGVRLMTQAVNTTQKKVQNEIDAERKAKQQIESESDENEDENEAADTSTVAGENEEQLSTQKKLHKARSKGVRAIEVVRICSMYKRSIKAKYKLFIVIVTTDYV